MVEERMRLKEMANIKFWGGSLVVHTVVSSFYHLVEVD
jgi:hypothetical protein